jgi:hypothetical protein
MGISVGEMRGLFHCGGPGWASGDLHALTFELSGAVRRPLERMVRPQLGRQAFQDS